MIASLLVLWPSVFIFCSPINELSPKDIIKPPELVNNDQVERLHYMPVHLARQSTLPSTDMTGTRATDATAFDKYAIHALPEDFAALIFDSDFMGMLEVIQIRLKPEDIDSEYWDRLMIQLHEGDPRNHKFVAQVALSLDAKHLAVGYSTEEALVSIEQVEPKLLKDFGLEISQPELDVVKDIEELVGPIHFFMYNHKLSRIIFDTITYPGTARELQNDVDKLADTLRHKIEKEIPESKPNEKIEVNLSERLRKGMGEVQLSDSSMSISDLAKRTQQLRNWLLKDLAPRLPSFGYERLDKIFIPNTPKKYLEAIKQTQAYRDLQTDTEYNRRLKLNPEIVRPYRLPESVLESELFATLKESIERINPWPPKGKLCVSLWAADTRDFFSTPETPGLMFDWKESEPPTEAAKQLETVSYPSDP